MPVVFRTVFDAALNLVQNYINSTQHTGIIHFCTIVEGGNVSSIFIYVSALKQQKYYTNILYSTKYQYQILNKCFLHTSVKA